MPDYLKTIFQYYAMISLACLPVSLLLFLYMYKKTDLLLRIDETIDRFLDKKEKQKKDADGKAAAGAPSKPVEEQPKQQPEEERAEEEDGNGIASFRLLVNDLYYCHLDSQHSEERIYQLKWWCDNDFIGEVEEIKDKYIFSGKKAGKVKVMCRRKDDAFDVGSIVYEIEVVPTDENWFASRMVNCILDRSPKDKMLAKLADRKLVEDKPGRKIMSFDGNAGFRKVSVQFDASDRLVRAVYFLKASERDAINAIRAQLLERFDKVKLDKGDIDIWIHRNSDESKNEVDVYAIFKRLKDGTWALGIGRTWREYGEIDEFVLNIGMAEKMFSECLPGEPHAEVKASENQKETKGNAADGNKETGQEKKEEPNGYEEEREQENDGEPAGDTEPKETHEEPEAGPEDGTVDFTPDDNTALYDDYNE